MFSSWHHVSKLERVLRITRQRGTGTYVNADAAWNHISLWWIFFLKCLLLFSFKAKWGERTSLNRRPRRSEALTDGQRCIEQYIVPERCRNPSCKCPKIKHPDRGWEEAHNVSAFCGCLRWLSSWLRIAGDNMTFRMIIRQWAGTEVWEVFLEYKHS